MNLTENNFAELKETLAGHIDASLEKRLSEIGSVRETSGIVKANIGNIVTIVVLIISLTMSWTTLSGNITAIDHRTTIIEQNYVPRAVSEERVKSEEESKAAVARRLEKIEDKLDAILAAQAGAAVKTAETSKK